MKKLTLNQTIELTSALAGSGRDISTLVVWDAWRGKVDANTIQICKDIAIHDMVPDIVRAIAAWNPDALPAPDDELLTALLYDLYTEVCQDGA